MSRELRLDDADDRREFFERMQAAERCPIAGPCDECDDSKPHHCALASVLRWETNAAHALELALDGVLCEPGATPEIARERLLARLCREHRRVAEELLAPRVEERESG